MRLVEQGGAPALTASGGGGLLALRPGFAVENRAEDTRTVPADIDCALDETGFAARATVVDPAGREIACAWAGPVREGGADPVFSVRMAGGFVNDVAFMLGVAFPLGDDDILLLPGAVHDGNRVRDLPDDLPQLSETALPDIDLPAGALSLPGAGVYWPEARAGFFLATDPACALGPVGIALRRDPRTGRGRLSLSLPIGAHRRRRASGEETVAPAPNYLGEGGAVSVATRLRLVDAPDAAAWLESVAALRDEAADHPAPPRLPLDRAARLALENLNERHWRAPIVLSGVGNPDGAPAPSPDDEAFPDAWRLRHGERGGAALAYALSLQDDATARERGRAMLDFIAKEGTSPSGLFYSQHARWGGLGDPPWAHLRGAADACYWMLRAVGTHGGGDHPAWRDAAMRCVDAFATLQRDAGEFGYAVGRNADPAVWEGGSAAGALAVACLALARRYCGREDLLPVAAEAGEALTPHLDRAAAGGGVFEAGRAADSRSAAALAESFLLLYEETHDRVHLGRALAAADQLALYALAHDAAWPAESALGRHRFATRGCLLRSVAEPRLGPGPGGHSPAALLRLYRATGAARVLRLLAGMVRALPQCVAAFHADLGELRRGMAICDIPLPDYADRPGAVREESRADTPLDILLARLELPGVYLDPPRSRAAAFDHLELSVDWEDRRATVWNPTPWPAAGVVRIEVEDETPYRLAPGEALRIGF